MSFGGIFSKAKSENDLRKLSKSGATSKRNRSLSPIRSETNSSELNANASLVNQNCITVDNLILALRASSAEAKKALFSELRNDPSLVDIINQAHLRNTESQDTHSIRSITPNRNLNDLNRDHESLPNTNLRVPEINSNPSLMDTRQFMGAHEFSQTAQLPTSLPLQAPLQQTMHYAQNLNNTPFLNAYEAAARINMRLVPINVDEHPRNSYEFPLRQNAPDARVNYQIPITTNQPTFALNNINQPYNTSYGRHNGFTLYQAISQIPTFDGSADRLSLFCAIIRDILCNFGSAAEKPILFALVNKLQGRAADGYTARLMQYNSIESLLSDLSIQYGNIGLAEDVLLQIRVITQNSEESAADYGLRVEKLLNRLVTIYETSTELDAIDRVARKRGAERDALQYFMFGLCSPLDHQVRCERPVTLREAISLAVDFESKQSVRRSLGLQCNLKNDISSAVQSKINIQTLQSPEVVQNTSNLNAATVLKLNAVDRCTYCNKQGHTENNCNKRRFDTQVCEYCDQRGHLLTDCLTLMNDVRNRKIHAVKARDNFDDSGAMQKNESNRTNSGMKNDSTFGHKNFRNNRGHNYRNNYNNRNNWKHNNFRDRREYNHQTYNRGKYESNRDDKMFESRDERRRESSSNNASTGDQQARQNRNDDAINFASHLNA